MHTVKIEISGRELANFCYWLDENIKDQWSFSSFPSIDDEYTSRWFNGFRVSSVDWENTFYRVRGLNDNIYKIDVVLYNDIDGMAVKLRW